MKAVLRLLVRLLFRFRAYNEAVLRTPGPVLLVPNHVSWLDWLFVGVCLEDDWKFVVSRTAAEASWIHRKIALNRRTFPIDTLSPYAAKHMAEFLQKNGRLVLFAEGRLSRTGTLMKLFEGTGFLLHKTRAKVITCYLRGAHRVPCSPNRDRKQWFPTVSAHFSEVQEPPRLDHVSISAARPKLTTWLRDRMMQHQFDTEMAFGPANVPAAVAAAAQLRPNHVVLEDVLQPLTFRHLLTGARLFARQLAGLLQPATPRVGVLLPNVVGLPVILLSLWKLGRVPAVLNYTTGAAAMLACAQLAGLRQIITSRSFLARARLNLEPLTQAGIELIHLEDVRKRISKGDRIAEYLRVRWNPFSAAPQPGPAGDDTAVVLFTSGSEGLPKGVELTHTNLLANLRQVLAIIDIQDDDRLFNALPMFHSFGLTVGTLLPLMRGCYAFLYPSPLHYRVVPNMIYFTDSTILLSTNTFLSGYGRKAHPMDFRSLRYTVAGAEKLQDATVADWSRRFGVRVLEGYGATECGPVVSVNVPMGLKPGTAGRLLPGMEHRLEPVDGVAEGGRLHVRGPNIMRGYLNADANARFLKLGGWYDTGDIAKVDDEHFVTILGRLKRFAKVSGEMISLTAVEEALAGAFPQYGPKLELAVVSKPDADKGEMLVAVTNDARLQLEEIRAAVRARGLTNLASPREVKVLKELPRLGTGKVNHRELEKLV